MTNIQNLSLTNIEALQLTGQSDLIILYYETICRNLEVFPDNGSSLFLLLGAVTRTFTALKRDEEELDSSLAAGRWRESHVPVIATLISVCVVTLQLTVNKTVEACPPRRSPPQPSPLHPAPDSDCPKVPCAGCRQSGIKCARFAWKLHKPRLHRRGRDVNRTSNALKTNSKSRYLITATSVTCHPAGQRLIYPRPVSCAKYRRAAVVTWREGFTFARLSWPPPTR